MPTEFEIQIWVLNFWREVEYTKIQRNEFSLCTDQFFFRSGEVEIRQTIARILKILRPTPGSTHFFTWKPTRCFVSFVQFTLGVDFPEYRITQEDGEDFSLLSTILSLKFEFEI